MKSNGKTLYVTTPSLPPLSEYVDEISSLWDTGILTHQGPKYQQLESEMCEYMHVDYVPLFANGHLALQMLLRAMEWPRGSEIITTPFTFASTTMAIVEAGYVPVFCDIERESYGIDPARIVALITPKTKAILGVHTYGIPCDVVGLGKVAKEHGLYVFYDAAHAFGEEYLGKSLASYGDASMLSFHATKVFNSVEGGALVLHSGSLYEKVCLIRQYGNLGDGCPVEYIGTNAKMTEMHAAMGLCNLRHFAEYIDARKTVFDVYDNTLASIDGLKPMRYPEGLVPNYAYYPVIVEDSFSTTRDSLADTLVSQGVIARKYFYPPTNKFEIMERLFGKSYTPIADDVSSRVLCLPLHANMDVSDAEKVVEAIVNAKQCK